MFYCLQLEYCNCMVSLKLTLQNCSECKIILLVLSVNRRTILMSPNYCANCTGCLYSIEYLTKLLLFRIVRLTANQPGYLLDSRTSYKPARTLSSSRSDLLIAPHRVKTVTASRDIRVAAPAIWNNLPNFVKVADSFNVFKHHLKCHLFDAAF